MLSQPMELIRFNMRIPALEESQVENRKKLLSFRSGMFSVMMRESQNCPGRIRLSMEYAEIAQFLFWRCVGGMLRRV